MSSSPSPAPAVSPARLRWRLKGTAFPRRSSLAPQSRRRRAPSGSLVLYDLLPCPVGIGALGWLWVEPAAKRANGPPPRPSKAETHRLCLSSLTRLAGGPAPARRKGHPSITPQPPAHCTPLV